MYFETLQNRGAAPAQPAAAPAAAPANGAGGAPNGTAAAGGQGADYSAQWAEYYRSVGKHKEAEAIEAQIKQKVCAVRKFPNIIPTDLHYKITLAHAIIQIFFLGCCQRPATIRQRPIWLLWSRPRSSSWSASANIWICRVPGVFCLRRSAKWPGVTTSTL